MPEWLDIVLALGGSAIISTVVGLIFKYFAAESKKKREERIKAEQKAIRSIMKEELVELKETSKMNQEGLVACLRRNILTEWNNIKDRGNWCTREEMENLDHMIEAYTKLGGNSFVQHTIVPYLDEEVEVLTRQEEMELRHTELCKKEEQLDNFKELVKVKDDFKTVLNKMENCPYFDGRVSDKPVRKDSTKR